MKKSVREALRQVDNSFKTVRGELVELEMQFSQPQFPPHIRLNLKATIMLAHTLLDEATGKTKTVLEILKKLESYPEEKIEAIPAMRSDSRRGRAYAYLKSRAGEVCSKAEIKQAIWGNKHVSDAAFYKIMQKIREVIESDPNNPQLLITVQRKGYILKVGPENL